MANAPPSAAQETLESLAFQMRKLTVIDMLECRRFNGGPKQ
jgi:hypothetical protein